jgi:hypothetical protein
MYYMTFSLRKFYVAFMIYHGILNKVMKKRMMKRILHCLHDQMIMFLNLKKSISKNLPYVVTFNQFRLLFANYTIVFCNVDKWYQN